MVIQKFYIFFLFLGVTGCSTSYIDKTISPVKQKAQRHPTSYIKENLRSPNQNARVKYIIIHYTVSNFRRTIETFNNREKAVSAHYVIPERNDASYPYRKLYVFRMVKECRRAWHAGISHWKKNDLLNDQSIGIELVNQPRCTSINGNDFCCFPDFDPAQIGLLLETLGNLLQRYPHIQPTDIIGHSDIAPGRKIDPNHRFPWELLHKHGYGAWFDFDTFARYAQQFTQALPQITEVQQALKHYGYAIEVNGELDLQTQNVITAFQSHFVQDRVTGQIDVKTCATLYALMEKYYPQWHSIPIPQEKIAGN